MPNKYYLNFSLSAHLCCVFLVFLAMFGSSTLLFGSDASRSIYSGGMLFLQPSAIDFNNPRGDIQTHAWGLGGILRIYPYKYTMIGVYGGTQKGFYETLGSDVSYVAMGYGGPMAGLSFNKQKFRFTGAAAVAFGTISNLHVESQSEDKLLDSYWYKWRHISIVPFMSIDYHLSQRFLLSLQFSHFRIKNDDFKFRASSLQLGLLINR